MQIKVRGLNERNVQCKERKKEKNFKEKRKDEELLSNFLAGNQAFVVWW